MAWLFQQLPREQSPKTLLEDLTSYSLLAYLVSLLILPIKENRRPFWVKSEAGDWPILRAGLEGDLLLCWHQASLRLSPCKPLTLPEPAIAIAVGCKDTVATPTLEDMLGSSVLTTE